MKTTKVKTLEPVHLNVTGCLRCGGSHSALLFKPFKRETPAEFKRWALCPVTKEPMLQTMVSKSDPRLPQLTAAGCKLEEVPQAYTATIQVDQKPGTAVGSIKVVLQAVKKQGKSLSLTNKSRKL